MDGRMDINLWMTLHLQGHMEHCRSSDLFHFLQLNVEFQILVELPRYIKIPFCLLQAKAFFPAGC